ncbi:hypothetical protein TWF173_000875 [Orbilia oligospora]|uniref:Copper acquisition factor BIM1-like domain-containing protein n=1 Tax=Arthrobotrys oligospora (strain ATCC 24927 / CBS 115.81 / DSM 1491) TaxID=756982 RepID=G1XN55_ARTOA|nr:hypothetical protein AOL_s00169g258 [Orbilia oligospora ATCC 24927]EGX45652.1 hypothetical protein AOL_s00169g258 [Orbilia oligospora ATCC 24927]KAF3316872.1 hypothetical protein TWF173_000875 [Orbilia oligospora]
MNLSNFPFLLALIPFTAAHFVLQVPTSLGFNDINEVEAPCGGFDITSRSTVTDWPIAGYPIGVVSTHPNALWQIRAALLEKPDEFVDLLPNIRQDGMGNFCLGTVPGYADWIGKDAVLQVVQTAVDGMLYQCAAIKFVEGAAAAVPGNCRNGSRIVASVDPDYTGTATLPTQTSNPPPDTTSKSSGANRSVNPPLLGLLAFTMYTISWTS